MPKVSRFSDDIVSERWECIGHNPTRWGRSTYDSAPPYMLSASVSGNDDGSWLWMVHGERFDYQMIKRFGYEPSAQFAMAAAEDFLKRYANYPEEVS